METTNLEFETIHTEFREKIRRYLAGMVGEAEAEDLTQEVFVRANQALPGFRGESQLSTWLYRIATNAAIDLMRTASFKQAHVASPLDEAAEQEDAKDLWVNEELPSPEQRAMKDDMVACFVDFVNSLPENYRTVVVLSELQQMTNEEIAEIMGLSLDTVKIRLHRGRERLLKALKENCKAEEWL